MRETPAGLEATIRLKDTPRAPGSRTSGPGRVVVGNVGPEVSPGATLACISARTTDAEPASASHFVSCPNRSIASRDRKCVGQGVDLPIAHLAPLADPPVSADRSALPRVSGLRKATGRGCSYLKRTPRQLSSSAPPALHDRRAPFTTIASPRRGEIGRAPAQAGLAPSGTIAQSGAQPAADRFTEFSRLLSVQGAHAHYDSSQRAPHVRTPCQRGASANMPRSRPLSPGPEDRARLVCPPCDQVRSGPRPRPADVLRQRSGRGLWASRSGSGARRTSTPRHASENHEGTATRAHSTAPPARTKRRALGPDDTPCTPSGHDQTCPGPVTVGNPRSTSPRVLRSVKPRSS